MLINFLKRNFFISTYTLVLSLIFFGMIQTSGIKHINLLLIYTISFYVFYFILSSFHFDAFLSKLSFKIPFFLRQFQNKFNGNHFILLLFYFSSFTVLIHLINMKGSPGIKSFWLNEIEDVVYLRRSITDNTSVLMRYISSIIIKAVFPFLIIYFWSTQKKTIFIIVYFIAVFYAFSLMQKSYVVSLLVPILIYNLLNKQWWQSLLHITTISFVVFLLFLSANTGVKNSVIANIAKEKHISLINKKKQNISNNGHIKDDTKNLDDFSSLEEQEKHISHINKKEENFSAKDHVKGQTTILDNFLSLYQGLEDRVLIIPGEVVSEWFDLIPNKRPFLMGDGYPILAKIKGTEYIDYSRVLYDVLYPDYAAKNFKGSLNVASFVNDYSNFTDYFFCP